MKNKKRNNKFIAILTDLYYRFSAMPLLFLLWLLLLIWNRRVNNLQNRLMGNRQKLDYMWNLNNHLEGDKYEKQQRQMKKFEKEFLRLEENLRNDEERNLKQKELFQKYLGKVFDPTIGE